MLKMGLLGYPVGHSLSPRIFQSLSEKLDVALSYRAIPLPPSELAGEIDGLHADGYRGVNVTIPHKQAVMECLDSLTLEARQIGAVNAVSFSGGKSKGHNTDAAGFLDALAGMGLTVKGLDAVVFGSGGSARAVGWALGKAGAKRVRFCARNAKAGKELAGSLKRLFVKTQFSAGPVVSAALWVNATPLGMEGFPDEAPASPLQCKAAFDLVYGRPTAFVRAAQAAGIKSQDGLAMLVYQALRGWEFWFKPLGEGRRRKLAQEILKELR
jgi:shikimate dehydrogenase